MKKLFALATICLSSLAYSAVDANQSPQSPNQQQPQNTSFHKITGGGNYTRAYVKPSANPSFSGNMGGAQAAYEYQRPDFFYAGANFAWRYGSVHASNGKRTLQDFNVYERLGYTFGIPSVKGLVTLFSGFGYRQLRHHVKLNGESSITLRYNHFYLPVGLLTEFELLSFFSLGANAIWMPQVFPTVTIDPFGGARWILRKMFSNFTIQMPFTFHLDCWVKNLSLVLMPAFELWQDGPTEGRSPSGIALGIPKNTYIFWGGDVSLKYAF